MRKQLKHKFYGILILGILFCGSCNRRLYNSNLRHDNMKRTYILYKPAKLPVNAPLVFVLHSYGRYAKNHLQSLQLTNIADNNKFAVCYPQETLDTFIFSLYSLGVIPVNFL